MALHQEFPGLGPLSVIGRRSSLTGRPLVRAEAEGPVAPPRHHDQDLLRPHGTDETSCGQVMAYFLANESVHVSTAAKVRPARSFLLPSILTTHPNDASVCDVLQAAVP